MGGMAPARSDEPEAGLHRLVIDTMRAFTQGCFERALARRAELVSVSENTMRAWALVYFATLATAIAAVDVTELWDFSNPALSEQRFRTALESASGDDALILRTQIARTYMLRKEFETARNQLRELEPAVQTAGPEAQARYWLEMGRSYASHRHAPESQTPETRQRARVAFEQALAISKQAKLDAVTIDALHMFVFVDTAPEDQLRWNLQALSIVDASADPAARRWEASIRSNTGEALVELGRYDEALMHFRKALALREQGSNAAVTRDARWHVARILRLQNHIDQALAIQQRIEREAEAAQQPRVYIFEELELLHHAKGEIERAEHYARRVQALRQ